MAYESFDETCARVYREVVEEFGDDGVKRTEAYDIATERVQQLVDAGALIVPAERAIRAALGDADERDGASVDRVLSLILEGVDALDMDDDPFGDRVAILGRGLRKSFRRLTAEDLREMDTIRYENMRAAQDAYNRWRDVYDPIIARLRHHRTIGDLIDAGGFNDLAAS